MEQISLKRYPIKQFSVREILAQEQILTLTMVSLALAVFLPVLAHQLRSLKGRKVWCWAS